jgi:branched-chain amino acid transport system ATP-binding protein
MGYRTFRYKLAAFTLAGGLGGIAGFLYAVLFGFVTPELLSWHQSGNVLLMVILGGMGNLIGVIAGAFAFTGMQEVFGSWTKHWQLVMGGVIVAACCSCPGGLAGIPGRIKRSLQGGAANEQLKKNEVLLVADKVTRRFGGLVANQDVNVTSSAARSTSCSAPTARASRPASTCCRAICRRATGKITFMGKDITGLSAAQRSLVGIGRSYQRTNIFPQFSVLENVRLAAQSRRQQPVADLQQGDGAEMGARQGAGLHRGGRSGQAVDWVSGVLSHGEQRQLEIAMVLATDAQVLLLDEPLAGMGSDESASMVEVLKRLQADPRHPAGRARHGCGVRGGRHHHRDGQRAGAGIRAAGPDQGQRGRPASLSGAIGG